MRACFIGFGNFHKHYQIPETHGPIVEIPEGYFVSKTDETKTSHTFEIKSRKFMRETIAFPGGDNVDVFVEVGMKDKPFFRWIFYWEAIGELEAATIEF